ncbi:MAG: tetratricopeptide repeat protein [Bacteroidales bacterium]|nr:tetratricopeptide repeat protein [Bacteroidales bacterium]
MIRRLLLIIVPALLYCLPSFAQDVVSDNYTLQQLNSAKDLYSRGMYSSAEQVLDELTAVVKDKTSIVYSEILANKILCAVALGRADIEGLALNFNKDYPNNPQAEMIKYYLAVNRFDNNEYKSALSLFDAIDAGNLYKAVEDEYHFKYGYSSLAEEQYDKAVKHLTAVAEDDLNKYTYPSYYYLGFTKYIQKDFNAAYNYFEKAKKDSRFTDLANYYQIESRFMLKDYDYVLSNGDRVYASLNSDLKNNLSRLISESYYAKGNVDEADKYFHKYIESGVTLTEKDRYYAGILAYSLGDYSDAVDAFADVLSNDGILGQSAQYYSANSYLQLKNKVAALQAFKAASESDADPVVKEDAFFNFAKLSFDVNKDISQFENYVNLYPGSGKDDIINSYMSVAFLTNKDYASAIEMIGKIKNPSKEVLANLQKARVLRAAQLMNNGGYSSAMPLLRDALASNYDPMITAYANFFYSECLYRNDQFKEAIRIGKALSNDRRFQNTADFQKLKYNLGYAYFKDDDYVNAQQWFEKYLQSNSLKSSINKDATLRLADVLFMQGKYEDASVQYQNVIARYRDGDLYPHYQSAMAYGLSGDEQKKIATLESATATSYDDKYYTTAVYELGRTYMRTGSSSNAKRCFEKLLSYNSDSTYHAKALLELAMISSNDRQYTSAINYYDRIIRSYPYSSEAQDALSGMESIYQMQNRPSEYLAYLDKIGMSNIKTADEKEMMVFSAAEQIYYSGNHNAAIKALQNFISQYPRSSKLAVSYFYLGEIYKAMQKNETAADAYLKSMEAERGDYSEAATSNYADISYSLGHYQQAIEAYETLTQISSNTANQLKGYEGKMLSFFGSRQYLKALNDAQAIMKKDIADDAAKRRAEFIAAKSYLVLGQRDEAKEYFTDLSKDMTDEIGAESTYTLIQDLYDTGDFVNVENKVYQFSDSGTRQLYWLARSFIVLGDSFADREEWRQARATFESIRDGYVASSSTDEVL